VSDKPAELPGKAQQQPYLHCRRPGAAQQMTDPVHQGLSAFPEEIVDLLQSNTQVLERSLLVGEGRGRLR